MTKRYESYIGLPDDLPKEDDDILSFDIPGIIADVPTANGRVYPKAVLYEAIELYNKRTDRCVYAVDNKELFAEEYEPKNIIGVCADLQLQDDGSIVARIKFNTFFARTAYTLELLNKGLAIINPLCEGRLLDKVVQPGLVIKNLAVTPVKGEKDMGIPFKDIPLPSGEGLPDDIDFSYMIKYLEDIGMEVPELKEIMKVLKK